MLRAVRWKPFKDKQNFADKGQSSEIENGESWRFLEICVIYAKGINRCLSRSLATYFE